MHSLIRNVGNGSNRHDLVGDLLIILPISPGVTSVKTVSLGGSKGGCNVLQDSDKEKLSQIFMNLFEKNVAKRSANDFEDS